VADEFDYKTINDPIHGSIRLSKPEFELIQAPTFLRLARLNQLGLAHFVFPGATHTRISHCIGAMHVMSRMIDSINANSRKMNANEPIEREIKQKLRLAALLHDIGHYPLSHATEAVFFRIAEEKGVDNSDFVGLEDRQKGISPLNDMCDVQIDKGVTHERFGKFLIQNRNDICAVLNRHGFDSREIAEIVTGEEPLVQIHSQLIHSALDADRLDYLLRDSHYAGVSYGRIDLDFLVANLVYDPKKPMFAVDYKAIPAFEHYLVARYYMYNNLIYHKTTMGFELMAKALYYQMVAEKRAIGDYYELEKCISDKGTDWLKYFHDEYFWYRLKEWSPKDEYFIKLKENFVNRKRLKMLFEERQLISASDKNNVEGRFVYLKKRNIHDSLDFGKLLTEFKIPKDCIALTVNKIKFEDQSPYTGYKETTSDEITNELGKIFENHEFKDLIDLNYSIIATLSQYVQHIRRLYFFDISDLNIDTDRFRRRMKELFHD
jgi:HD superfamily phosphohydrolase